MNVIQMTLGTFFSIFTGLNLISTVGSMRPPQMTWFKVPLFLWSLKANGVIQVIAISALAITCCP